VTLRTLVAAAAAGALLAPATAVAQDDVPYGRGERPHDTLSVPARDDVAVRQFVARFREQGDRIQVRVTLRAVPRGAARKTLVLRLGRCSDGSASALDCPPVVSRRVVLRRGDLGMRVLDATIRKPSRRFDAVQASLTAPGRTAGPSRAGTYAVLELRSRAWRFRPTTFPWGLYTQALPENGAGFDLRSIRVDAVGITPVRARPTLRWDAVNTAGPATVRMTTKGCLPTQTCRERVDEARVGGPEAPGSDFRRPTIRRDGDAVSVAGTRVEDGAALWSVTLPFPER
jgi:hypothetical protein